LEYYLKYISRKIPVVFEDKVPLFTPIEFNGICFSEEYSIPEGESIGDYQIILSKKVFPNDEMLDLLSFEVKMIQTCEELNKYQTYVTGSPINVKVKNKLGVARMFKAYPYSPEGWSNNKIELLKETRKNKLKVDLSLAKIDYGYHNLPTATISKSPLNDLVNFLRRKTSVNPLIHELIYFHSQAFRQELDIKYLILGKALEIARELLPYKNNLKKSFELLPIDLKKALAENDLNWIYSISQNRYETRHIINKKEVEKLHPKLTRDECWDFARASNLLITYLVRKEFELDEIIWNYK